MNRGGLLGSSLWIERRIGVALDVLRSSDATAEGRTDGAIE
jgi:hypothetical protein